MVGLLADVFGILLNLALLVTNFRVAAVSGGGGNFRGRLKSARGAAAAWIAAYAALAAAAAACAAERLFRAAAPAAMAFKALGKMKELKGHTCFLDFHFLKLVSQTEGVVNLGDPHTRLAAASLLRAAPDLVLALLDLALLALAAVAIDVVINLARELAEVAMGEETRK